MEKRTEGFVRGLRELANFYEFNPDLEVPALRSFDTFVGNKESLRQYAERLGSFEKVEQGSYFVLRRWFGNIKFEVNIARDKVCRRVKVGEREVPAKPAHTKPIYEYECPDSLFRENESV